MCTLKKICFSQISCPVCRGTDHFPVHCNDVACAGAVTQRGHVAVEGPAGRAALGPTWHHSVWHPVGNEAWLGDVPVHQDGGGSVGWWPSGGLCRQTNQLSIINDHSSPSWAGLLSLPFRVGAEHNPHVPFCHPHFIKNFGSELLHSSSKEQQSRVLSHLSAQGWMLRWGSLGWGSQTHTGSRWRTDGPSGCPGGSSSGERESCSGTWTPSSGTKMSSVLLQAAFTAPPSLPSASLHLSRRIKEPKPSAGVISGL